MGQTGYLTFFTEEHPDNVALMLRALLEHIDPESIFLVSRTLTVDNEWELFQEAVRTGSIADDPPMENLRGPHTVESTVKSYVSGRSMMIGLGRNSVSERMYEEVRCGVPEEVRSSFVPSGIFLRVGSHDIFESTEHDEGLYFARAFTSVKFCGHDSPHDLKQTRDRILALPEVNAIKAEFEEIVGPLEATVMWYV